MVQRNLGVSKLRPASGFSRVTGSRLADAAGAGLLVAVGVAVLVSAQANAGGDPLPALATLAAAGIAYAAGRLLAPVIGAVAVLVVGALGILLVVSPNALSDAPTAPPLGYANANAALYVQVAALVAIAAATAADDRLRTLAAIAAGGFVVLAAVTGSQAGFVTGLAVVAALVAALTGAHQPRRAVVASCVSVVLLAHLMVLGLGATYGPGGSTSSPMHALAASWLSERRLALWHDSVVIATEHPVTGIGPGRFSVTSPTALADADTREAHSATLQMAAETGWFGAAALLGLLLWTAIRPLLSGARGTVAGGALIAAASVTALAVHASVDYVLAFPVVVATAALVVGAGTARPAVPATAVAERPPPRLGPRRRG